MFSVKLFRAEMYLWRKAVTLTKDEEGFYFKDGKIEHIQGAGKRVARPDHCRRGIFSHFHPLPQSRTKFGLSYGDMLGMLIGRDKQMRVVYHHGVYRVKNPYWDRDYVPYFDEWDTMLQSEGLSVITHLSKEDVSTWVKEDDDGMGVREGDWHHWYDSTYRREFKPKLKRILGLTLDFVPFGII